VRKEKPPIPLTGRGGVRCGGKYWSGLCGKTTKLLKKPPYYIRICVKITIFAHKICVYGME